LAILEARDGSIWFGSGGGIQPAVKVSDNILKSPCI
jgi:hypothetical protein